MQPEIRKTAEKFKKQGIKRRLWQRIVSGLTCIVVFCTTYALILPAITMEGDTFCGKTEHIHDPSCYNGVGVIHCDPVHYHSSGCYGEEGDLVCGQNEYVLHTHDSLCYGTDGSLICTLPEIAAHVHGDSCYTQVMPEGHRHEDGCYTLEQGELTCGQEESEGHGHGEGCYGEQVLICQIPESAGHAHEPGCYSEPSLVCGQEEIEGHAHGEDCYGEDGSLTCQLPEVEAHVHGDGCYTQELICGQEESEGHSHGGTCFETPLVCTLAESEGHTHGDGCYAWNQVLVCQLEEVQPQNLLTCTVANEITHVHTEACRTEPELVCGQEVHTHTLACYSDSGADVETAELWKATMAGANLSGSDAQNLVTIAQTQLGYAESSRNYAVLEDGITIRGYSRYGAWAGTPYADWSELFVEFCLHYAGISETDFPWRTMAKTHPETPASGDVIFLELENEQYAGIVTKVSDGYVTAILGDYHNEVRSETFSLADPDIKGYASMREEDHQQETEEAVTETTADETSTTTAETTETTVETTVETTEEKVAGLVELEKIESIEDLIVNQAMFFSLLELADGEIENSSASLTDFLTNVVFLDSNGNPITNNGTLHPGENYSIMIAFAETPSLQFSQTMSFQLPEGITIPEEITGRLGKGNEAVANYTITKDGMLIVNFVEDWQNKYQNASFTIDFNGIVANDKDKIIFTDKHTFNVEKPKPELYASKSGSFTPGSADESGKITGGTLNYEVVVTAKNTNANGIVIKDTLTSTRNCELAFIEESFVVTDNNGNVIDSSNYTVTYDESKQGFSLVFKDDYQLAKDAQIKINYSVDVSSLTDNGYVGFSQNNSVTINGKDDDGETLEDTADKSVWVSVNNTVEKSVNKRGEAVVIPENAEEGVETGIINWTVDIVNGNGLAGATVTDMLGEGLTWDGGAITVTCVVIDTEGNESTKIMTIDPSAVTQGTDEHGKTTLTFTLPETDSSGNALSYERATLIYGTNYNLSDVPTNGSENFQNTIEVNDPSGEGSTGSSSGHVTVPGVETEPTTINKELQTGTDTNNGHTILNYTVTVNVPGLKGGYSPFYVSDTVAVKANTDWHFTPIALVSDAVKNLTSTVKLDGTDDSIEVPCKYVVGDDGKLYIYYNGEDADTSKWTIEEDATIIIHYSVDLDELLDNNAALEGILNAGGILKNTATNHFAERTVSDSSDYSEGAEASKTGRLNEDGTITYTVLLEGLSMPVRESINKAGELKFIDTLPTGWEYVGGTFAADAGYNGNYYGSKYQYSAGDVGINSETNVLTADIGMMFYGSQNLLDVIANKIGGQEALSAVKFTYQLKPTQAWQDNINGYDKMNIVNTANFRWGNQTLEEAKSVVEYGRNPLDKSAVQDGTKNNLIHFSIDINALQDDLTPDTDLLTITDTMSSVLDFDIKSLKVINANTSEEITGYTTNYLQGQGSNTLTITGLPDSTYLRITYDAYINETGSITFTNTVELKGKAEWKDGVDSGWITVTDKGGADGSTGTFYIHKVDSNTGASLSGASFEMYLVGNSEVDTEETDLVLDGSKTGNSAGGIDYQYWYDLGDYSVWELENQPGWFQAGFNNQDWNGESKYIVEMYTAYGYRLVLIETEAPTGYKLLQAPIVIAYGDGKYKIPNSEQELTYSLNETDNVVDYAGTVTVENTPLMDVSVNKVWTTTGGGTPSNTPAVDVALIQVAHYGYEEEVVPTETYTLTITDSEGTNSYLIGKGVTVNLSGIDWNNSGITIEGGSGNIVVTPEYTTETVYRFVMNDNYSYTTTDTWRNVSFTYDKTYETQMAQNETALYTATLSSSNNWSASWNDLNLPATGTVTVDGVTYDCTYTYHVKELTAGEWTTTYSVDNITIGTNNSVTITNTYDEPEEETVDITVNKVWLAKDGKTSITMPDVESIQFYLLQDGKVYDNPKVTDDDLETPYTLAPTNNDWSMTITGLPKADSEGNAYTYSVGEEIAITGYDSSVRKNEDGTWTITNQVVETAYELPETGGAGTFMYTLSGLVLCGTAALGYNHKKRRKEDHSS